MTASAAIVYALVLSILLIVFALGARASLDEALFLFRRPKLLGRAVLAIYVVVPLFALTLSLVFPLSPPAKFALIALAVSPVPPILPVKQMKVGGDSRYAIGLLVAAAVLAVIMTPLLVALASNLLGAQARIAPMEVARPLLTSIVLPLAAGIALKRFAPWLAESAQNYASKAGTLLLLGGLVVIFLAQRQTIVALVGNGTVLAIASMVGVGLLAGHLLGGDGKGDRAALALAAATRHPGVAVAIATANFPNEQRVATAAILLFLLVNLVVTMPYVRWIKGRAGQGDVQATAI